MRILFAGTPDIAVPSLAAIAQSSHEVVGVLTAPDRRAGRGRGVQASPVKELACDLKVPVFQPERLGRDSRDAVAPLGAELLACVAYGKIFGPKFLDLFQYGGINLHPSLLPLYRGPAPIPAALLAGDTVLGITIQDLAIEMDSGDILLQSELQLTGEETTGTLTLTAADAGARMMVEAIDRIAAGSVSRTPQHHAGATYTRRISKTDGAIDWSKSALEIERAVRAYHPWPLAFTTFAGQRLNILKASVPTVGVPEAGASSEGTPGRVFRVDSPNGILIETGNGLLAVTELQLQARKALNWKDFLNGVSSFPGAVLGS